MIDIKITEQIVEFVSKELSLDTEDAVDFIKSLFSLMLMSGCISCSDGSCLKSHNDNNLQFKLEI